MDRPSRRISRPWEPSAKQTMDAMSAAQQFIATLSPEERADHKLLVSLLEGQTDVFETLDSAAEYFEALKLLVEKIEKRLTRLRKKRDKAQDACRQIADAAQLPDRIERPFYLAGYDEDAREAHIIDESLLPREVLRPDKRDITARLKRGEIVSGAVLNNPGSKHFVLRFA
jgi:ribosome-associated translation inhibitor RaiA